MHRKHHRLLRPLLLACFGLPLLAPLAYSDMIRPNRYNWDLTNKTGKDVYDIAIVVKGKDFWSDTIENTDLGVFYQVSTTPNSAGNTVFHWQDFDSNKDGTSQEPIKPDQTIHVGLEMWEEPTIVTMYWTNKSGGPVIGSVVRDAKIGTTYHYPDPRATLEYSNSNEVAIHIRSPRFAVVSQPLELAALGRSNEELMGALEPAGEDFVLAPGESARLEVPAEVPVGSAVVMVYEVSSEGSDAILVNYAQILPRSGSPADEEASRP